ncbi:MAG: TetR family transcriptional regulator [Pseudomonadota bacterium]|nr:TetR family transcriptional regulator [Pseudomonadota bacterium]
MSAETSPPDGAARLLDAALRVIGRKGLDGLTHRAVAAEAGMSLGAVTHRFGKREGLADAALAHAVSREVARAARLDAAAAPSPDLAAWAAAVARHFRRELSEDPDLHLACYEALLSAARDPRRRPLVAEWAAAWEAGPRRALTAAGAPSPARAAALMRDAMVGRILRALAQGENGEALETALATEVHALALALRDLPAD